MTANSRHTVVQVMGVQTVPSERFATMMEQTTPAHCGCFS
jgi:hypothetical protein